MKQETNNEIDLLLRRMSRSDGGSMRDGEQHLDVDELSSYAQNALPAPARARYMEHLAECSTCRKLVTELSLSLGATAAAAAPVATIAAASGLKKFLASLFSPMVMRYAVPALGVIIVAVVGFVILRDRRQDSFVAQLDEQRQAAPLTASPQAAAETSSPNAAVDNFRTDQSGQVANPKETASKSGDVSGDVAGTGPAPAATPAPDKNAAAPGPKPVVAAEPPPAKTDATTESQEQAKAAESEEQKKKEAVAKKQSEPSVSVDAAATPASTARANEPVRDLRSERQPAGQRVDESKREALPVQKRHVIDGVGSLSRGRAQTDKDDAETRTVSGRRFRKERGIWTDTAYDSSTATVNVARGSEQFRALVADEPEIKKIAEQLDGEVIVVWKGRAYRIR